MPPQVFVQSPIEILTEEVCAALAGVEVCLHADRFLCSAEVVDGGVEGHVGLEIKARTKVDHDAVDSPLEIVPATLAVSILV
jgi:hypothetical protein